MPKKAAAKGKKKKEEPPAVSEKDIELGKRLHTGYLRRLEKYGAQPPFPDLEKQFKKAGVDGSKVETIVITEPNLEGPMESSRLEPLFEAIRETGYPYVRHIFIWHSQLRLADVLILANHIMLRSDLLSVELMHNNLQPSACSTLGEALRFNKSITKLKILHNPIRAEGLANFCKGLILNETLQEVVFDHCMIGPEAGVVLGDAIPRTLWKKLSLDGNQLRAQGLEGMAIGLAGTDTLEKLSLIDNEIDMYNPEPYTILTAFKALREAMLLNTTLKEIDMSFNTVGDEGGKALLEMHAARKDKDLAACHTKVGHKMSEKIFEEVSKVGAKKAVAGKKKVVKKKKK